MRTAPRSERGGLSRGALLLIAFAAACVLVPGLFWWGTTFTRRLDDARLVESLAPGAAPRDVQHAIEELSRRFAERRPGMDRWAEDLVRVSRRPEEPVRIAAAWCMQFDPGRDALRARLREMVADDPSPMVRRNAATSLAKAGDAAALPVLRSMLEPFEVDAPVGGALADVVRPDQPVEEGGLLGRILPPGADAVDVRAPVPGRVGEVLLADGAAVTAGAPVLRLLPSGEHVRNAVLALALVGEREDLDRVRQVADPRSGYADDVREAAAWAAERLDAR